MNKVLELSLLTDSRLLSKKWFKCLQPPLPSQLIFFYFWVPGRTPHIPSNGYSYERNFRPPIKLVKNFWALNVDSGLIQLLHAITKSKSTFKWQKKKFETNLRGLRRNLSKITKFHAWKPETFLGTECWLIKSKSTFEGPTIYLSLMTHSLYDAYKAQKNFDPKYLLVFS